MPDTDRGSEVIHRVDSLKGATDRVGVPKVDSAETTIAALNPDVKVEKYATRLDASNIMDIIQGYDIIVDGVDNFPTRYLLNDATVRLKIPVVSAAILGFVVLRAIVQALMIGAIVDVLHGSSLGRWTLARALRTFPVALAVGLAGVGLLTLASILGPLLGPAFGLLIQMAALVGGVYLLGFAPVIAAEEGRRLPDTMGRSIRAARIPGAGNLTLAAIYVVASIALLVAPWKPGSNLGVNPSVGAWVLVLVANLLHVAMQATLAFRYLSIADEVPEPAAKRRPEPRGRGRR